MGHKGKIFSEYLLCAKNCTGIIMKETNGFPIFWSLQSSGRTDSLTRFIMQCDECCGDGKRLIKGVYALRVERRG